MDQQPSKSQLTRSKTWDTGHQIYLNWVNSPSMQSNTSQNDAHLGQTIKEFSNIKNCKRWGTLATISTAYNQNVVALGH